MTGKDMHRMLLGLSLVAAIPSLAQANPYNFTTPCRYKANDGNVYTANPVYNACAWVADEDTYCPLAEITGGGHKFSHGHPVQGTGTGFPFPDKSRGNEEVTANKANLGYDSDFPGWTCFGGATLAGNCHSYTFGYTMPILNSAKGSDLVRVDEGWTISITAPEADCIEYTQPHSQKINFIYNCTPTTVRMRSMKSNASGFYYITYESPGVAGANMYKK